MYRRTYIMKQTDSIEIFIGEKIAKYCKLLSINRPTIITRTRQVLDLPKNITKGRRTSAYKYYGVSYLCHDIVFINVRRIENRESLDETLRHELIHFRFPYLSHGVDFEKKIKLLKKDHTWKPSKSHYLDKFS